MVFGKRVDIPTGCRKAAREELVIRAAIMTMTDRINVDLLDISKTGTRLRGHDLPAIGQEVLALFGRLEAFATVVWLKADQCGLKFDVPLSDRAVEIVESERVPISVAGLDADSLLALNDWHNGLAR